MSLAETWPWQLWILLTIAAAVAHSFPVSTPDRKGYHVSPPFFVAAFILLTPLQLTALVAVVHVVEQMRRRRAWYGQLFNTAAYAIAAAAGHVTFSAICGAPPHARIALEDPRCLLAGVAAAAVYLVINHALVGLVIWLANGIPPRQQQFDRQTLL